MILRKIKWEVIFCLFLLIIVLGCGGGGEEGNGSSLGGTDPVSIDQLPVHIVYVNHVEVESVLEADHPLIDGMVYVTTPEKYAETKALIEWEISQAEAVEGKISFHMSGAYAEQAMAAGDKGLWENHIDQGHTVGVHTHGFLWGSNAFEWVYKTSPTQLEINKHWIDNYDLTAGLAGAAQLWIGESHFNCRACWEELGYTLATTESMALLPEDQHIVWQVQRNPQGYITYPHFPQIGKAEYHGSQDNRTFFDLRVPQLKKEFLMLYLEWLERERLELAPQVFAWGWCNHGGSSTERYSDEIKDMLNWLNNNFANKTSARGNHIARFVSDHDLSDIYATYEQSGEEPMPSPVDHVNDQFPYMAYALKDAGVMADLSATLGIEGVRLFALERQYGDAVPPVSYQRVYLLFREDNNIGIINITGALGNIDPLTLINVTDGAESPVSPDNIYLGPTPLVLEEPD